MSTEEQQPKDEEPEPINQEDIENFMKALKKLSSDQPVSIEQQIEKSRRVVTPALEMWEQGPNAETPLAKLWADETIGATFIGVMISPAYNATDKAQLLSALTIVALRMNEISIQ